MCGYGLSESTVGIVGLGRIGEAPTTCSPAFSSAISLDNGCPLERLCVARLKKSSKLKSAQELTGSQELMTMKAIRWRWL